MHPYCADMNILNVRMHIRNARIHNRNKTRMKLKIDSAHTAWHYVDATRTHNGSETTQRMQLIDAETERAMQERERRAQITQAARDARRADYDYVMDHTPTKRALDMIRERVAPSNAYTIQLPRASRVHRDTRMASGPNLWEDNAPRQAPGTHKHECPHMTLVKCHHRW